MVLAALRCTLGEPYALSLQRPGLPWTAYLPFTHEARTKADTMAPTSFTNVLSVLTWERRPRG